LRRRWKIAIVILGGLAALCAVNAVVVNSETQGAEATAEGGEIANLPGGAIQVVEDGPAVGPGRAGRPIVLIHGYGASLRWWDRIAPILARRHRVVRVDLLGHGGSENPSAGYSMPEQAALVAGALNQLGIQGAIVVGHSMGFDVAVALAEGSSELTDRLVNIGSGASEGDCSLPFLARLAYAPVLGEALWRTTPDFAIRDGFASAFAPDFDIEGGFDDPDQVVADYRAMTFTSFADSRSESAAYVEALPLDERVTRAAVPLLSIFGAEDEICDPRSSQAAYQGVSGARTETIESAGHSPHVERPRQTAAVIERFAAEGEASPRR
jgi:pimeloyl-ACP methyl ester carboxylesterase